MNELELFLVLREISDPMERVEFLESQGVAPELRARIDALLSAETQYQSPLDCLDDVEPRYVVLPIQRTSLNDGASQPMIAGKYALLEVIGEGGMGSVWRAQQTEPVKRFVAVKLIKAGMDSKQVLARFEAERQALALMDHPNIAKVLDGGLHENCPFFVMELVKGTPITEYCDAQKLHPRQRLALFVQVCQAIQHAHQKGIIHRDIKPSNVLVTLYDDKPVVKVIDFGLAKATSGTLTEQTLDTGFNIVGTPEYMSPEQATFNNLDIDTRSDVYALGVLLYELLTGSPPFYGVELKKKGLLEILRVVREEDPPRPSIKLNSSDSLPSISADRAMEPNKLTALLRAELDWILLKALEKDRSRRYETANSFAADVQRYLAGEPVQAHPQGQLYRMKKFVRRNRVQVMAMGVVALTLIAGIIGTTWGLLEAKKQEILARNAQQAEAQRANGEKIAKEQAEKNLALAKKGNEILGSIFMGLEPRQIAESGRPLQDVLRENLGKAVQELDGQALGDPLEMATMQMTLGQSLAGLGESSRAIQLFQRAVATRQDRLGPEHPDTLDSMNSLAVSYLAAGKLDKAVALHEETLHKRKKTLGVDHPDTLASMNNLALGYRSVGKLHLAIPLLERSLESMKQQLGPDHPNTLNTMNNLANSYLDARNFDLGLPLLEQTFKSTKQQLGPDHPHTLISMNSLAAGYFSAGKLNLALPLFEKTLKLQQAKLGPDHPSTLNGMNNLAAVYSASGKRDLALPIYQETYKRTKAKFGPDHPSTLLSLSNLATCYHAVGQLDLALQLFEESFQLRKAKLGPDHPDTLASLINLAKAYQPTGNIEKLLPLWDHVSKANPKDTALTLKVATLEVWFGRKRERQATIARSLLVAKDTQDAATAERIAKVCSLQPIEDPKQQETALALAVKSVELGKDSPYLAYFQMALGMAQYRRGLFAEAQKTFAPLVEKEKHNRAIAGTVGFYRAMTLFRLGKTQDATTAATDTLRAMRPLPRDEKNPLADDANADEVIVWLACKEAKALIGFDVPPREEQLLNYGSRLLTQQYFAASEPFLRESLTIREKKEPEAWTTFNTQSALGGALMGQKKYAEAEPLLVKGYLGLKLREDKIPPQAATRIPEALDRLIELFSETKKPDEVKKYQQLRAKYPKGEVTKEKK
jgi:serine/threonine protein kinase/tetratricopeptide (TPR) repeat protein